MADAVAGSPICVALLGGPGEPSVMAALVRSLLARLLARRGDPEADVLAAPWPVRWSRTTASSWDHWRAR